MDLAIQGIAIIAAFSLAHERFIELVRWLSEKLVPSVAIRNVISGLTTGPAAALLGTALAYATNANLLDAFRVVQVGNTSSVRFFDSYLQGPPTTLSGFAGCALMGFAVTLGSAFWHDFAKVLIDLRGSLQANKPKSDLVLKAAALRAPPPAPSTSTVSIA